MSPRAAVTTTPYGEVDAAALEGLQARYDTTRVLDAVDTLDELRTGLRARLKISPGCGLRQC